MVDQNKIPEKFTMPFEPNTIEHLGLKLYHFLPPVVGEMVSNAWDADSPKVEITLPNGEITEKSEVIIRDYGTGMDGISLQKAYLPIGRNCREELARDKSPKGRFLMGRKGIGKLSAFGVATEVELRTIKNSYAICIKLDYEKMKNWPKGKDYEPAIIREKCGQTSEKDGTEIHLRQLHRITPIDEASIRSGIARRFIVINDRFQVIINGKAIKPEDRRLKEDCKKTWDVKNLPQGNIIDVTNKWKVEGWIGLIEKSSQIERGVDVFAKGKAVELETMFGLKTTHIQFARAYVVGEIQADFIDKDEDNVTTGRNAVHWESVPGQKLEEWGRVALTFIFDEWLKLQHKEKEDKLIKTADFDKWLNSRSSREQRVAKKLIKVIVEDQNIEPESAKPLLDIIKTNIEFEAFRDLVDEMEEKELDAPTFLKLFSDWRIIEAREHLKLSDGRLEIMDKLDLYIRKGALEVKQLQPLFEKNGWLINPTWTEVTGQNRYTELLRKHCKEPSKLQEKDRRIDILGYAVSGELQIVELKRPGKTLSRDDLEQIEHYVDWARNNIVSTAENAPKYVKGLLLVGNLSSDKSIASKMERLAGGDIRVDIYDNLLTRAKNIYGEVEERLKKIAPEYSSSARKALKKRK